MIKWEHPKGLMMLFFVEMWERFSFYGMRALLTLYLTLELFKNLQDPLKKSTAIGIYAAYGALVYATPFIGGLIADKFLGHKKSVILGAVLMAVGHFVMAIETQFWLYIALAFLIMGNGFFKPNISSMIGGLYKDNDSRRDGGFTIFYMGINLGAFLAPLICGTIGEIYGWKYGFGIAGIGMMLGLLIFMRGKKSILNNGDVPNIQRLKKKILNIIPLEYFIYFLSVVAVGFFALLVRYYELMSYVLLPFSIAVIVILLVIAIRSNKQERERMFVILILLFFTTLFWAFFEQAGSSLTLFAKENVDRFLFSKEIPASLFQSVNPLFILVLAPLFSMIWISMAKIKKEPSTPLKFMIGVFLLGIGFLILAYSPYSITFTALNIGQDDSAVIIKAATVPMMFLVLSYLLQTMGELCLSPIGLSMVTKLASKKIVAMVMGAWFLSSALAHHLGGAIANLTSESEQKNPVELVYETLHSKLNTKQIANWDESKDELLMSASISGMQVVAENYNKQNRNNTEMNLINVDEACSVSVSILQKDPVFEAIAPVTVQKSLQIALSAEHFNMQKMERKLQR
ncbi:MAG: peptide MFS transporter [Bacteroidales bacterium]|nr:peptide MFS transporter [Bacteroidales bacterium]